MAQRSEAAVATVSELTELSESQKRKDAIEEEKKAADRLVLAFKDKARKRIRHLINSKAKVLDIGHCDLDEVPGEIRNFPRLRVLCLSHNMLDRLPPEIGSLTRLRTLHAWGNAIQSIPSEIGLCTKLEVIDLSYNQIEEVPPALAACVRLSKLYLQNNFVEPGTIPASVARLPRLRHLYIHRHPGIQKAPPGNPDSGVCAVS